MSKTSNKKTSTKKTAAKKKPERKKDGKGTITFFMGALIQGGYLGEEIPEEAGDQRRSAMRIRQMAEKLARQTRRFGDEDVGLSTTDGDGDGEGEDD